MSTTSWKPNNLQKMLSVLKRLDLSFSTCRATHKLACDDTSAVRTVLAPSSLIFHRSIHSSSFLHNPRFKLLLERTSVAKVADSKDDDQEDTESKEGSYLKSHPYRTICNWKSKSELAQVLLQNQIYNDNGLFVTNKPFGVGVKNPIAPALKTPPSDLQLHVRGLKLSTYTIEDALPELRLLLNKPKLVNMHSAEKLASGIAIFADNEEIGMNLNKALKSSRSHYRTFYKYLVVTVLPPLIADPHVVEHLGVTRKLSYGSDVSQPVLTREITKGAVQRQDLKALRVQTKIIDRGYNAGCLVEINTTTVKNNFLRIHCADKLAPMLGDHLYSSRVRMLKGIATKIDPGHLVPGTGYQILSDKIVELLLLKRREDSVMVPPHMHLRSYKLRKFLGKGSEIEFVAPYPQHFLWTCRQLGIHLVEDIEK